MVESIEAAERVRVVVRVRPPNDHELQQNSCHHTLTVDDEGGQVFVCKKKSESEVERELRYSYDRVFNEKANQSDVFNYLRDGVQQVAQGFNCTVFAYGQTGTGKTHTMLGQDLEHHLATTSLSPEAPESFPSWGVIPRAIESLFDELQSISRHGSAGVVHCSYMQIYNNDVYDLLQDNKKRMKDPLAVREMIKGNAKQIYVTFTDQNTDNERFEQAAKAQELILQEIQTERRELERQLGLLSSLGDNQGGDSSGNGDNSDGNEDPCPICGNDIDDHNDAELDRCIELEMKMINQQRTAATKPETSPSSTLTVNTVQQQRPNTQTGKVAKVQVSGPRIRVAPRSAASDPRLRRVSTSAHGKARSYISNEARKPSTPPQAKVSNTVGKTNGLSEKSSKEAFTDARKGASRSSTGVNNQTDSQSSLTPQMPIPILRQGHKGLKALKKFRATSPYNNAVPRKKERATPPEATSNGGSSQSTNAIVNSARDIGLELSVYKFRYDCWYNCTIVSFDRKRRMHCCQYDCGDKQWQDLSGHKAKVIGRSDDSS
ncbi:hypothetical protein C6341_g9108 [Phytophthora cactorum]|nr:hypothetical protein C6341_g9108 [Phytophthora cactorum]